jgi:hypothetical protein
MNDWSDGEVKAPRQRCKSPMKVPLSTVSASDLLDPEPLLPVIFQKLTRPSTLRGRAVPKRKD